MNVRQALLCCTLLLGSSCGEFLSIEPQNQISRADAYANMDAAERALLGAYQAMGDPDYYRQHMLMYPEMAGNLVPLLEDNSTGNSQFGKYFQAHNLDVAPDYTNNQLSDLYEAIYAALYQINDFIDAIPDVPGGSEADKTSLLGEALHLRAVAHFDLLRLYAQRLSFTPSGTHPGIALVTEPGTVLDARPRATVADCFARIIADLEAAIATIDPARSQRNDAPIWATPEVAKAALTQVLAYAGDWPGTLRLANELIESTELALSPPGSYVSQWETGTLDEVIWKIDVQRFVRPDAEQNIAGLARVAGQNTEEPYARISEDLYALFAPDDIRRQLYPNGPYGRITSKYPFVRNTLQDPIYLRLSTIYLWRAEAAARLNDEELARQDYDRIHRRAVPTATPTTLSGAELLAEILRERRRELALEGDLLFDLSRRGADIERTDCLLTVRACSLPYPSPYFILPIPEDALERNDNLVQNEGY